MLSEKVTRCVITPIRGILCRAAMVYQWNFMQTLVGRSTSMAFYAEQLQ